MNVPALTGIRGVAALWVVLYHVQSVAGGLSLPIGGWPILRDGWVGVDLFFVLSGFILMLVHGGEFRKLTWLGLRRFALLRLFRIYPLATIVLLLIAALVLGDPEFGSRYAPLADPPNLTAIAFLRTLLLSTRWFPPFHGDWNQPIWSLSVEILGYCAFPVLALLAMRLRRPVLLGLIALVCLAAPLGMALAQGHAAADDIFEGALIRMAGAFAGGVALGRLHGLTPGTARRWQGLAADAALLAVLLLLLSPLRANGAVMLFGVIVYGIAGGKGVANWLFGVAPSMLLGRLSFPLYLVHVMPLLWLNYRLSVAHPEAPLRWLALGGYFAVCLMVSWLLHIAVERPSQLFGKRLAAVRSAAATAGSAAPQPGGTPRTPASSG